jgi:soluble lytic murein transglycosylase-like protein
VFRTRFVLFALTLAAVDALPAAAQIFTFRDASGRLVLSNTKPTEATHVKLYAVHASPEVRSTRFAAPSRAAVFDDLIVEHARQHGVRQSLVRAVIQVESAFNPHAVSEKGAVGLMQLMPATAREFGVRNAYNPDENVRAGVAYLRQLLDRYDNNEELALAAYNAGPGAVDRYGQNVPPYRETKDYVGRVNGLAGRAAQTAGRTKLYRIVEIVNGHEVVKYTDRKP